MAISFVLCAARHLKKLTRWWDISECTMPIGCATNVVLRPILFTRGCNTFKKNMKVNGKKKIVYEYVSRPIINTFIFVTLQFSHNSSLKSY